MSLCYGSKLYVAQIPGFSHLASVHKYTPRLTTDFNATYISAAGEKWLVGEGGEFRYPLSHAPNFDNARQLILLAQIVRGLSRMN